MTPGRLRAFAAIAVFLTHAGLVTGQASRPADDRAGPRWTLAPPLADSPCPSHLETLDAPKDLVFGTFKLANPPRIADGDTISVEGLRESLRFVGLDAEETFKDPGKKKLAEVDWKEYLKTENAGFDPARPPKYGSFMGEAAKDAMRQILADVPEVRLEWDDPERKVDNFGRHLVFVLIQKDGRWVNLNVEMVRQGLSPYFVKYGRTRRMHGRFVAAEREAQAHERGIWRNPGVFHHYPDYDVRLKWWNERADAIEAAERLRKERTDFFVIGRDDDWQRLRTMAGRTVTVFGSPGTPIPKSQLTLLPIAHRRGLDFMIVGTDAEIAKLDPQKQQGNLLCVTGVVEIYKGEPQFRARSTSWSRSIPTGAESAPASR